MIAELVRFGSFIIPIPFMVLFYVKSSKFEALKNYITLLFFIPVFTQLLFVENVGYNIELITAYLTFVVFGSLFFSRRGYTFAKSLSLAFCLTYFGSFLWEVPYHVYTIVVRGGIDGAFPLHVLFVFPMIFVYEKFKTNFSWDFKAIIYSVILFSSFQVMIALLMNGYNVWNSALNPMHLRIYEESLWMVSRIMTMVGLFIMYSKSTLRKKVKKCE